MSFIATLRSFSEGIDLSEALAVAMVAPGTQAQRRGSFDQIYGKTKLAGTLLYIPLYRISQQIVLVVKLYSPKSLAPQQLHRRFLRRRQFSRHTSSWKQRCCPQHIVHALPLLSSGYALTMVDSLDMHAVVGDGAAFREAVGTLLRDFESGVLTFDRDVTVSVFEASIRVLGGLVRCCRLLFRAGAVSALLEKKWQT